MIRFLCNAALILVFVVGVSLSAIAQEESEAAPVIPDTPSAETTMPEDNGKVENALPGQGELEQEEKAVPLSVKDETNPDEIPSLFFTPEALALLKDAITGLNPVVGEKVGDGSEKDPGIRELALGGIVFNAEEDWTIWLNGRRIQPNAIPGEVFDLNVTKEYIDIKWYDEYTNRIYPIRLRPNERFNLDSRLFLTGSHSDENQL